MPETVAIGDINEIIMDVQAGNRRPTVELVTALGIRITELLKPIRMILTCPSCSGRHIDKGLFAIKPHHTHACQHCGLTWRPAVVNTVGVQFLPGFKDES